MNESIANEDHLKQLVNDKINWCIEQFKLNFHHEYSPGFPEIIYKLTGNTAGWAYAKLNTIKLNRDLLLKYGEQFINRTVVHEMAHRFVYFYYTNHYNYQFKKATPHGKEWKDMMIMLGINDPQRCHSYEVVGSMRKQQRHHYTCLCGCQFQLSTTKHNKINKGQKRICRKCKSVLIYIG